MKISGCIHDGWLVLKDKSGLFNQDYLYYFKFAAYKQFDNLAAGSTVRNLNTQLVKNVIIPIPDRRTKKNSRDTRQSFRGGYSSS
jgi:type I restriction enzyme S subunit